MNYSKNYKHFNLLEKKSFKKQKNSSNLKEKSDSVESETNQEFDFSGYYRFLIILAISITALTYIIFFVAVKPANRKILKLISSTENETENFGAVAKLQNEVGLKSQLIGSVLKDGPSDEEKIIKILSNSEFSNFNNTKVVKETSNNYLLEFSLKSEEEVNYVSEFLKQQESIESFSIQSYNSENIDNIAIVFKISIK